IRDKLVTGVQTCALPIFFDVLGLRCEEDVDAVHVSQSLRLSPIPGGTILADAHPEPIFSALRLGLLVVHVEGESTCPPDSLRLRSEERRVGKECRSRWSA